MAASLTLGAVDLMGAGAFKVEALGSDSGTSWGNAVPITEQLQTFLQYGAIVANNGWENREVVVVVRAKGDGAAMAAAEAALFAEVGKPNTLTYTPPAVGSPAMQFRVIYSQLESTPDDLAELLAKKRVYTIRLTVEPFPYSATLTNVPALASSGSTTTLVDAGSSTTGWTATVNGGAVSPSVVSGAVQAQSGSALSGAATVVMTRTGSIATSSTPYIVVDWKTGNVSSATPLTATGDGIALTAVANGPSPTTGYTRTTFIVAASSVTTLVLTSQTSAGALGSVVRSLSIDNINRSDIRPGSAKQQLRTLSITGSAPTIGSLAVEHATVSLGDVVVYTCHDDGGGYVPACRAYRTSSAATASDTTAVSGAKDTLDPTTALIYEVPAGAMPGGEYLAAIRYTSTVTFGVSDPSAFITWAYVPRVNATNVAAVMTPITHVPGASTYSFARLGMIHLPSVDMPGSGVMRFALTAPSTQVVTIDEFYLFNVSGGRLSQFACGTGAAASGGPAKRLWIDSPSIDNDGQGRYLMGHAADRSDAYSAYPAAQAVGIHEFAPGSLKVFTVTTNPTTAADVSFAYYASWANHAAS